MQVLGVDFSGAQADNNTWLTQGLLEAGGLTLHSCRPVSRGELTETLSSLAGPAVAALDFPFSVPLEFARYWQPEAASMPQLWAATAAMEYPEFLKLAIAFGGEPKRRGDLDHHRESYSPLHRFNPNMVPMTFQGMRLLHRLGLTNYVVPPLEASPGASTTLLEAMPGAALKAMCLPYKGYKNGARNAQLRQEILDGLAVRSSVPIENLDEFREKCLASHDCLDAVVAAVVAALWARDPAVFRHPPEGSDGQLDPTTLIEGWLYAPVFLAGLFKSI